jgi:hypothetical protein
VREPLGPLSFIIALHIEQIKPPPLPLLWAASIGSIIGADSPWRSGDEIPFAPTRRP